MCLYRFPVVTIAPDKSTECSLSIMRWHLDLYVHSAWEGTHPFTFLSLSSFGSRNPVKTTVPLHREEKQLHFILRDCYCTITFVITERIPWGPLAPLFRGSQGPQKVRVPPGKHREKTSDDNKSFSSAQIHIKYDMMPVFLQFMSHTCSPFLPGRPDRPWIPASPWTHRH